MEDPLAGALVEALYAATPVPIGCRVNHARGILVQGFFRPAAAPPPGVSFLVGPDLPALVRFSSSTGDVAVAQDDPKADPRGLAVQIGDPAEFVLVGHSIEGFPAPDAAGFLRFLTGEKGDAPVPADEAAQAFAEARAGPPPTSFAARTYHMLHPYQLDDAGKVGRIIVAGDTRPAQAVPGPRDGDYLDRELRERLGSGPARLIIRFHPAPSGVAIADVSRAWPDSGDAIELGSVFLERIADDQQAQQRLTFDPGVLPPGIAFAGDGMIAARLAAYQQASRRRRGD